MPPDKAGEGKRKLPEPPEPMETPDKNILVPAGSPEPLLPESGKMTHLPPSKRSGSKSQVDQTV